MDKKIIFLVFALFGTIQAATVFDAISEASLKKDWLVDDIAGILEFVAQTVNDINTELKKIDFSSNGLVKYLQNSAAGANQKFLGLLDRIRKDTSKKGEVIIDCLKEQQTIFETDVNKTLQEIGHCSSIGMSAVKWYMGEYIVGMDWIRDNLNTYAADMRNCTNQLAVICVVQVMEKNGLNLPTLIGYFGGRIGEIAIGIFGGIAVATDLERCAKKVSNKHLETYAKQVFNSAVNCIEKKW